MDKYIHESSEKKPWELTLVHFNGNGAKDYFELFMEKNNGIPVFLPQSFPEFEKCICSLMGLQREKDLQSELQCSDILLRMLNTAVISAMQKEKLGIEESSEVYRAVREIANERYQEHGLIRIISEKFGISEDRLNAGFEKAYGIELQDYILNRRFTAAKELLRFTIKPVKEIVEESGLGNGDLLRRLFLDEEGMSAEEYRNKWAQWVR